MSIVDAWKPYAGSQFGGLVDVTIYYCRLCGLEEPARAIAAALHEEYGLVCETREGFWGTFRIEHGGEQVFNRWTSRGLMGRLGFGRTPDAQEVVAMFRERGRNGECASRGVTDAND